MAQLDPPADRELGLRAATAGPAQERGSVEVGEQVAGVEHRGDEADIGVSARAVLVRAREPVEPGGVDVAGQDLLATEQVQEERLVRGPAPHDHGHLREGAVQTSDGLGAVTAMGDDLCDHRVVLGRDDVALGHAGVDPDARPEREGQRLDRSGRGGEVLLGVLGIEPGLDGVALGRRRLAVEATARGNVQLELDEVQTRRELGHRVLDLQSGVDLEEGEALLTRLVEELDGARVLVASGAGQAHGGCPQVAVLLGA